MAVLLRCQRFVFLSLSRGFVESTGDKILPTSWFPQLAMASFRIFKWSRGGLQRRRRVGSWKCALRTFSIVLMTTLLVCPFGSKTDLRCLNDGKLFNTGDWKSPESLILFMLISRPTFVSRRVIRSSIACVVLGNLRAQVRHPQTQDLRYQLMG